ncbi:MAG: TlpA family protein disulfide reductase [Myxococcales bacterium]|nr:TlpA family protein disulfide reductase [Myxococcales bacterium]
MSRGDPQAPKAKQRKENPNQIYITAAMVLVGALVFGLVLLPRFDPAKSPLVSEAAPDFALEVIHEGEEGARIRLSNLKGKPVLLDFWASWCGPCRMQAPIVDQIAREYGDRLHVVGVDTGDALEPAQVFAKSAKLSYPSVFDPDGATAKGYGVSTLPTLVLIDKDGTVRMVRSSVMQRDALKAAIEPLLD